MSNHDARIKPTKNGPLQVEDLERMTNSRDEAITLEKETYLCRCGGSKQKPFCDGTHARKGFQDKKSEDRVLDQKLNYVGKKITIHDNRGICSHAGFCSGNLPLVFHGGEEPWIDADAAESEEIKRVIRMCPSGALSYTENGVEYNHFHEQPEIHVAPNGPYYVRGNVSIKNKDMGDKASDEHYTLCRCGQSRNKPRCDGSHWYAAFKDDEALTISRANRREEEPESVWYKVAELGEIKENQSKKLSLNQISILLVNVNGTWGAVNGVCPHEGGPIIDATLENGIIRCPWHGHAFDPLSGHALGDDESLKTYDIEQREDGIYLRLEKATRSSWTTSHVVAETMVNWGIRHVFGMVGHSNLGMAEALRIQEKRGHLEYIGIRHEGAAAFACSGYAKVCGTPAACLTIAGPGATNLMTGLWDAHMDRAPVLALTGQINTQFLGPGSFQEIELKDAFQAVAPFSKMLLSDSNHAELTSLAMKHAIVQRQVSHLVFPNDIQTLDAGTVAPGQPAGWLAKKAITPDQTEADLAMAKIYRSKRPVIIAGYGARDNMPEIIAFAEQWRAPVLTTFKAKGQIPDDHPLATGVLGKSGTPVSSYFMNHADLLLVFGASFSQHTGIDRTKPIIQVDHEQMALAKFHAVAHPIWGDAGLTANLFRKALKDQSNSQIKEEDIALRKNNWRLEKKSRADQNTPGQLNAPRIFEILSRLLPEECFIALDVGNNAYDFGRYFESKKQRVVLSGYLGSIGFSFPAAMGAWYAGGKKPVFSISGDGGFGQYLAEFNTAVQYKMNITHILLNNHELAKISQEQRDEHLPIWKTRLSNPNFSDYARNCGGFGIRISDIKDLEQAVLQAMRYEGPALVELVSEGML
jgi:thiamine pyrophosphate-dependent acetolactate synthase large subunit-like protein/CDGSH-type Zn-finger protein/nitrite reductase/ring-hydroxylating ferredoxin subunit